jgi:hypothetical protein
MSVEREYGGFRPVCDDCGAELTVRPTFESALAAMKRAGWMRQAENGEWRDLCPECAWEE